MKSLIRHRLFEKLEFLQTNHHHMSADAFQTLFNRWDMEVMQLMLALEKWLLYQVLCDDGMKETAYHVTDFAGFYLD